MKLWYRFVCAFVAVAVVLFSVRVPDVDADDVVIDGKTYHGFIDGFNYDSEFYQLYDEYRDEIFDADGFIDFSGFCFKESNTSYDYYYIFGVYLHGGGGITDAAFVPFLDESTGLYNISCTGSYFDAENNRNLQLIIRLSVYKSTGEVNVWSNSNIQQSYFYNSNNEIITWNSVTMLSNIDKYKTSNSTSSKDISTYQLIPFGSAWDNSFKRLTFTVNPELSVGMDLTILPQQFTLTATNETNNYYNYVFYISSSPASSGVQKSFSDSVFIMSSNQWCMKYSWSSLMPDDDVSISDWIKDSFGRVIDPWGNIFNVQDSYMGRHGSGSSDDGIYYYTLSQQKKCPFYLIKPNDSRAHVIPYSALNLSLDTTYYANIIYFDTSDYGVVPSSNSWGAADTSHNNYRSHPLYNLNLISRFSVYSSTEFSVTSGNFTKDDDGLYDYKDVVDNSNPASSSATISSEDNSVSINNANSYDNSSSVSYINYGTIYHNCSWSGSGGSSSGARPSVPELPEAEFENLYEQSGNFFDFVADVLDAVGAVPMLFITAAFAVLLFLRIWGR